VSTTIGFGFHVKLDAVSLAALERLANAFDYGLAEGIEHAENDMRTGLQVAQRHRTWKQVVFLLSPRSSTMAFGIDQELTAREISGIQPPFFSFMDQFGGQLPDEHDLVDVFFSGEWYERDQVRYTYGNLADFIGFLSMPGHWGLRHLIPETGHFQDSDEIPLVFALRLNDHLNSETDCPSW